MKVLIIAHNPMSPLHSIGKTLMSLFSQFDKEELCELYIHTGKPVEKKCNSYYQITDKDVLKGLILRKVKGRVEAPVDEVCNKPRINTLAYRSTYGNKNNRKPYRELLRDFMWTMSPWYTMELKNWIEREKPTHIFVAIGSSVFLYDIAIRISEEYSIPVVTYVCDDFYFMEAPKTFLGKVWKKRIVRKTKLLMKRTSQIVSICDEMTVSYSNEFDKSAITVMTGTNFKIAEKISYKDEIRNICYFGKLSINRYRSMADLCRICDWLNRETNAKIQINIYCGVLDEKIRHEFEDIRCAVFHDFVNGLQFSQLFFAADALIHIEAFDKESVDRVRNSISTKIADSLSSGIPMLAYAPSDISSMKYLMRNKCAFTATNREELVKQIESLLTDAERRKEVSMSAIKTAMMYHDPEVVSSTLYKAITIIK